MQAGKYVDLLAIRYAILQASLHVCQPEITFDGMRSGQQESKPSCKPTSPIVSQSGGYKTDLNRSIFPFWRKGEGCEKCF